MTQSSETMAEHEIFLAALEIADQQERAAYLEQACSGDAMLREQVNRLLAAHARSGEFLDVPVLEQLAVGTSAQEAGSMATGTAHPTAADEIDLSFLEPSAAGSLGRLGHYEIREVIGRGGCGIVLKAFDEKLERIVAIKVMAPELAATSPARKRFLREARATAAIRHENVVNIYAVEEQPLPFLVMEYIHGETLQQRLDRTGPLEVLDVLRIGQQIASGLAAAHAKGLIHRDIKPSNILLETGTDQLKITDFGLARTADDASMTQSGVIAGTPLYMSPEQAQARDIDPRSDLFSLGSVLYMICTGRPPFRAATSIAVLRRVVEEQPRPIQNIIPEVPPWLVAIIARLHAKNPGDRFASAQEVGDLLARCLAELTQHGRLALTADLLSLIPVPSDGNARAEQRTRSVSIPVRTWVATAGVLLTVLTGLVVTELTGITDLRGTAPRQLAPDLTQSVSSDSARRESDSVGSVPRSPAFIRGNWRVEGDVIEHAEPGRQAMILFGSPELGDGDLTCEALRAEGDHGLALVARATDLDNYYYFDIGVFGNNWHSLYAKETGVNWRRIDQQRAAPVPTDRWVRMHLRLRGSSMEAYLDDQLVLTGSDDRRLHGYIGLRTWNEAGKYRNLKFTDPTGKVLWEGLPVLSASSEEVVDGGVLR